MKDTPTNPFHHYETWKSHMVASIQAASVAIQVHAHMDKNDGAQPTRGEMERIGDIAAEIARSWESTTPP